MRSHCEPSRPKPLQSASFPWRFISITNTPLVVLPETPNMRFHFFHTSYQENTRASPPFPAVTSIHREKPCRSPWRSQCQRATEPSDISTIGFSSHSDGMEHSVRQKRFADSVSPMSPTSKLAKATRIATIGKEDAHFIHLIEANGTVALDLQGMYQRNHALTKSIWFGVL